MTGEISSSDQLMLESLYWWDIASLFRCPVERDPNQLDIALVGVPHSTGNGTTGTSSAPRRRSRRSRRWRRTRIYCLLPASRK